MMVTLARLSGRVFLTVMATVLGAAMVAPWEDGERIISALDVIIPLGLFVTSVFVVYFLIWAYLRVQSSELEVEFDAVTGSVHRGISSVMAPVFEILLWLLAGFLVIGFRFYANFDNWLLDPLWQVSMAVAISVVLSLVGPPLSRVLFRIFFKI